MTRLSKPARAPGKACPDPAILVAVAGLLAASAGLLAACVGGGAPLADVTVGIETVREVGVGQPIPVVYRWEVGADYEPVDATVFAHFVDANERILGQDDHLPPRPPRTWRPGEVIVYERWMPRLRSYDAEHVRIVVGLHDGERRFSVRHRDGRATHPVVGELIVDLEDHRGVAMEVEGWHRTTSPSTPGRLPFAWTTGRAVSAFRNPRQAARLHLLARGPGRRIGQQRINVAIDGHPAGDITVSEPGPFHHSFVLGRELFGTDPIVEVELRVAPAFVPRRLVPDSSDGRTLGLQVFNLYLERSPPEDVDAAPAPADPSQRQDQGARRRAMSSR